MRLDELALDEIKEIARREFSAEKFGAFLADNYPSASKMVANVCCSVTVYSAGATLSCEFEASQDSLSQMERVSALHRSGGLARHNMFDPWFFKRCPIPHISGRTCTFEAEVDIDLLLGPGDMTAREFDCRLRQFAMFAGWVLSLSRVSGLLTRLVLEMSSPMMTASEQLQIRCLRLPQNGAKRLDAFAAEHTPGPLSFVGRGQHAMVFGVPGGDRVLRLSTRSGERPEEFAYSGLVLQPLARTSSGGLYASVLPRVRTEGATVELAMALCAALGGMGIAFWDCHPGNIGQLADGKWVVIDPGSVRRARS